MQSGSLGDYLMVKCQILSSEKNKEHIKLSSAEFAHDLQSVKSVINTCILI